MARLLDLDPDQLLPTTRAVRKRLEPAHLAIVAVGTASALAPRLEALPGVRDVTVVKPRDLL